MIENFQIKGLERLINSSVIKDIYPMVMMLRNRINGDATTILTLIFF